MVRAKGFEPSTSWSRISSRNTILLARLALFCVEHADMDPYSAAIGLKSDPTICTSLNAQISPRFEVWTPGRSQSEPKLEPFPLQRSLPTPLESKIL